MNTPFVEDLETVVAVRGSGIASAVESLRYWSGELAESTDILFPGYYQGAAAGVGLLIADSDSLDPGDRFRRINANIGNLWNCWDHIVDKAGGFQSSELRGLKTNLRGVENIWFDRDVELLSAEVNPGAVLQTRLREISRNSDARKRVAVVIARSAGWEIFE
ncbi:hypothetical protein AB0M46_45700 [Dactylosporangium sp. NPDC051485]|uniref:hypothetical protein n=1 Tax=Dactylosporangium sp. NPDC051485 TaxID=3154846 RepID=UPI003412F55F